jgi:hypothetical protein
MKSDMVKKLSPNTVGRFGCKVPLNCEGKNTDIPFKSIQFSYITCKIHFERGKFSHLNKRIELFAHNITYLRRLFIFFKN